MAYKVNDLELKKVNGERKESSLESCVTLL
jgi:hypothetical protein